MIGNTLESPALPHNPAITSLIGGQPLSFKIVTNVLTLTKLTATDNKYAGAYYGGNGSRPVDLTQGGFGDGIRYISTGFFNVPCTGAVVAGAPLYLDETTGFYSATVAGNQVAIALSACAGTDTDYIVKAELIK